MADIAMTPAPHRAIAWLVIVAAALLLRVADLGRLPLAPAEAAAAWGAWASAEDLRVAAAAAPEPPLSAVQFGFQRAIFWVAGSSDTLARLPSALAGTAVLLAPWLLQPLVGGAAAFTLAVLLAFDPALVAASRRADGAAMVTAAAWILIAGLLLIADRRRRALEVDNRWPRALAVLAGLGIASGPAAWDFLPPLVVGAILAGVRARNSGLTAWQLVVPAVLVVIVTATSGFADLRGTTYVAASLDAWLRWWRDTSGVDRGALWLWLLRAEMLPLALGVGGLAVSWSRRWSPWLLAWVAWGAVLTLRPGRSIDAWLVMAPPLMLAAATATGRLVGSSRASTTAVATASTRVAAAAASILLVAYISSSATAARDETDRRVLAATARPQPAVRYLADDVAGLRRQRLTPSVNSNGGITGATAEVEIVSPDGAPPALAWLLRNQSGVVWARAASLAAGPPIVVEPVTRSGADLGEDVTIYPVLHGGGAYVRLRVR